MTKDMNKDNMRMPMTMMDVPMPSMKMMNQLFKHFNEENFDHMMKADIFDHTNDYQVKIELPGFHKNDIHVQYKDNYLMVNAMRDMTSQNHDENGSMIQQERNMSNLNRQFFLPNVDKAKIVADYTDGMLDVTLPKLVFKNDHESEIKIK